jgi:LysM repeat protein
MNEKFNSETSGHGVGASTWVTIFLVVIALHLIVILSVVGFKLLKGVNGIPKNVEGQASKELKPSTEDYPLNPPPEEKHSLKTDIPVSAKTQVPAGKDDNDDETEQPPLDLDKLIASPDSSSEGTTAVPETPGIVHSPAGVLPKPVKSVAPPENSGNYYIVVEGDTLSKIANNTGASADEIRKKNHLEKDVVKIGQKLLIPGKSDDKVSAAVNAQSIRRQPVNAGTISPKPSAASVGGYKVYRVGKGDTLTKIAAFFHISPEKLAKINDISDPRKLKSGMEIKVPKE